MSPEAIKEESDANGGGPVARVTSTVTIERPVQAVYQHFLELDKSPSDPDVVSASKEPDGPTGPGTTFRFRHDKGSGKMKETTMRFTSIDPKRSIDFEGDAGPVRPRGTFIFEPAPVGTRLTVRIDELNPVGPLSFVSPMLARAGKRIWDGRLKRIKMTLEAASG